MTPEQKQQFRIISAIEGNPEGSQREFAKAAGMSVGRANYLIHALVEKGLLKIGRFYKSKNRLSKIVYILTPEGIGFRIALTHAYLEAKRREFDQLRAEIEALERASSSDKRS